MCDYKLVSIVSTVALVYKVKFNSSNLTTVKCQLITLTVLTGYLRRLGQQSTFTLSLISEFSDYCIFTFLS